MASNGEDFQSEDLKEFTIFQNLAIELRLKIWKYAFPGPRHVNFVPTRNGMDPNPVSAVYRGVNPSHPFIWNNNPVTLSVNMESRIETLLHYYVLHPRDITLMSSTGRRAEYSILRRPICLNTQVDSIYWNQNIADSRDLICWINHLNDNHPAIIQSIRVVEIRNVYCPMWLDTFEFWMQLGRGRVRAGQAAFPGVRMVVLTENESTLLEDNRDRVERAKFAKKALEFLESSKDYFIHGPPELSIRKLEGLSDYALELDG